METQVRLAVLNDAPAIASVKRATWSDEPADSQHIARVMAQPGRATVVASRQDGQIVGFTDGFMTLSHDGFYRWEVDLVAVHPDARGAGLASRMIAESTQQGKQMGASAARALIHVDNLASQRSFLRCGYKPDETICALFVCSVGGLPSSLKPPAGTYLLPVNTFGYRGVWLEGTLTADSFVTAQNVRKHYGWDVAGAVIPQDDPAAELAESVGYTRIGLYQWWWLNLD